MAMEINPLSRSKITEATILVFSPVCPNKSMLLATSPPAEEGRNKLKNNPIEKAAVTR